MVVLCKFKEGSVVTQVCHLDDAWSPRNLQLTLVAAKVAEDCSVPRLLICGLTLVAAALNIIILVEPEYVT